MAKTVVKVPRPEKAGESPFKLDTSPMSSSFRENPAPRSGQFSPKDPARSTAWIWLSEKDVLFLTSKKFSAQRIKLSDELRAYEKQLASVREDVEVFNTDIRELEAKIDAVDSPAKIVELELILEGVKEKRAPVAAQREHIQQQTNEKRSQFRVWQIEICRAILRDFPEIIALYTHQLESAAKILNLLEADLEEGAKPKSRHKLLGVKAPPPAPEKKREPTGWITSPDGVTREELPDVSDMPGAKPLVGPPREKRVRKLR